MIVLYWMTPDPIVVNESTSLMEVFELAREHGVRRFPVVRRDAEDELCGIIARTDLYRRIPSKVQGDQPPPEDVAQVLRSETVGDLMNPRPITCTAYDHVEDCARTMKEHRIGAMPVLNRGHLVGIISEIDLLGALTELSHQGGDGKRVTIRLDEQSDEVLYEIVDLCARHQLRLLAILTHDILNESKVIVTLRVSGEHLDAFVQKLWDEGYHVLEVT